MPDSGDHKNSLRVGVLRTFDLNGDSAHHEIAGATLTQVCVRNQTRQ